MDTIQYCLQSRKNKHLNSYERGQIALLIDSGLSPYAIAKKIKRAPNTFRTEILRSSVPQIKNGMSISTYFPDVASANIWKIANLAALSLNSSLALPSLRTPS